MRFSFDGWTLDADRRLLLHGSDAVSLSPKAFDLLKLLAEHDERAFSKAELHQHLWPNTFVSDGSLTILVAEIRQVLQDDADRPQFIRTVRRFGYGFCAPVARTAASQSSVGPRNAWVIWGNRSIAVAEGKRSWVERSRPPSVSTCGRVSPSRAHQRRGRNCHG